MTHIDGVLVTIRCDRGLVGRGEAYGIIYEGETPDKMVAEIKRLRPAIEAGATRSDLLELMGHGGARCALDFALWDLEAKQRGTSVASLAGLAPLKPLTTAFTIGIKEPKAMGAAAKMHAHHSLLKVKVKGKASLEMLQAVHANAPRAKLIVDPNQSWDFDTMHALMPALTELNVALLEQPLSVDGDARQLGYEPLIPICADELIHDRADLAKARGKYQVINIKLDKAGGLTEGLALAQEALAQGFKLMVGCMAGSSLSMAPHTLIGQLCDYVDLDGPLLQSEDWPSPITYSRGVMSMPEPALWG